MSQAPQVVAVVLVAAATAGAISFFAARGNTPEPAAPAPADPRLDVLGQRIDEVLRRLDAVERTMSVAPERSSVAAVEPAAIEAAVRKWFADRPAEAGAGGKPDAASTVARLADLRPGSPEMRTAWKDLREAGLEEAVLAHYAALAAASPGDAEAQYRHGAMLIEALQDQPMMKTAALAGQADAAFDKALAADPQHWAARYSKAISLSFWPKIMGKQPEAIRHFELLAAQQEKGAPAAHYAQTYVFLGNLYADSGDTEKARAAYERGLRWYPDNDALKQQAAALRK